MSEFSFSAIANWSESVLRFYSTLTFSEALVYGAQLLLLLIVFRAVIMIVQISQNKIHSLFTKPLSRSGSGDKQFLILGDSTAVGTGADRPDDTIAGQLAADYPAAGILNMADNGALIRDLEEQIKHVSGLQFDMIFVSVGGNDVWHMTRSSKIRQVLYAVLPELRRMSNDRVLFFVYNNIGSAPAFPAIIRWLLRRRGKRLQALIREVTYQCKVPTIDLFSEDEDNPFLKEPRQLFSTDGIHPSSAGYRMWYRRMWRIMHENGYHL